MLHKLADAASGLSASDVGAITLVAVICAVLVLIVREVVFANRDH